LKAKYRVFISRQAEQFYKKSDQKVKVKIKECLVGLEEDAYAGKQLHGDLKENYSLRVGKKLRIVYKVLEKEKTVYIIAIGPRRNIYQ